MPQNDNDLLVRIGFDGAEFDRQLKAILEKAQKTGDQIGRATEETVRRSTRKISEIHKQAALNDALAHGAAAAKMTAVTQRRTELEASLEKVKTQKIVDDLVVLQRKNADYNTAIRNSTDKRIKETLRMEQQAVQEQSRIYSQVARERAEVNMQGMGAKAGLLGVGRNLSGVFGMTQLGQFAGMGAAAGGVLAAGYGLKYATDAAMKYQDAIAGLSAITGVTGKGLDDLSQKALGLSKKFGLDAVDSVNSFKLVISQLGIGVAKDHESLAIMSQDVDTLAKASGEDASTAVLALTTTLNQFGGIALNNADKAKEMTKIMNVLSAGALQGAAELPDLQQAMEAVGSTAHQIAHVSVEEATAAIETLSLNGLKGAEAGTMYRNVLVGLSAQTKTNAAGFKILGISLKDVSPEINGQEQGLRNLKAALDKIQDPVQRSTALVKIFGKENLGAGEIILNNIGTLHDLTKAVTGTHEAERQAAIRMNTASEAAKRAKAQIDAVAISIGTGLLSAANSVLIPIGRLVSGTSALEDSVTSLKDSTEQWKSAIADQTAENNHIQAIENLMAKYILAKDRGDDLTDITKQLDTATNHVATTFDQYGNAVSISEQKVFEFIGRQKTLNDEMAKTYQMIAQGKAAEAYQKMKEATKDLSGNQLEATKDVNAQIYWQRKYENAIKQPVGSLERSQAAYYQHNAEMMGGRALSAQTRTGKIAQTQAAADQAIKDFVKTQYEVTGSVNARDLMAQFPGMTLQEANRYVNQNFYDSGLTPAEKTAPPTTSGDGIDKKAADKAAKAAAKKLAESRKYIAGKLNQAVRDMPKVDLGELVPGSIDNLKEEQQLRINLIQDETEKAIAIISAKYDELRDKYKDSPEIITLLNQNQFAEIQKVYDKGIKSTDEFSTAAQNAFTSAGQSAESQFFNPIFQKLNLLNNVAARVFGTFAQTFISNVAQIETSKLANYLFNPPEKPKGMPGGGGRFPGHAAGFKVPSGYPNDTYIARLTSGESIVPSHLTPYVAPFLKAHGVPGFEGGGFPSFLTKTPAAPVEMKKLAEESLKAEKEHVRIQRKINEDKKRYEKEFNAANDFSAGNIKALSPFAAAGFGSINGVSFGLSSAIPGMKTMENASGHPIIQEMSAFASSLITAHGALHAFKETLSGINVVGNVTAHSLGEMGHAVKAGVEVGNLATHIMMGEDKKSEETASTKVTNQDIVDAGKNVAQGIQKGGVKGGIEGAVKSGLRLAVGTIPGVGGIIANGLGSLLGFADGGRPPIGIPYKVGERGVETRVDYLPGMIYPNHYQPQYKDNSMHVVSALERVEKAIQSQRLVTPLSEISSGIKSHQNTVNARKWGKS